MSRLLSEDVSGFVEQYIQMNYNNPKNLLTDANINEWQQKSNEMNMKLHQLILDQESERSKVAKDVNEKIQNLMNAINKFQLDLSEIRTSIDHRFTAVTNEIHLIENDVKIYKSGELIWKIEQLSSQISDPFYSTEDGYKLRLQLVCERSWLSIRFDITLKMAQTAKNSKLPWPVEFDVRMGIINQDNGRFITSQKQVIVFESYTDVHQCPFKFVFRDHAFWRNNQLILKCIVS